MRKKKILILAGGPSKEREISFLTAKSVKNELLKSNFNVKIIDTKKNFVNFLRNFKPDVVFNALHGQFGEDGYIQTILESEKVKYTHSGPLSSSLAMDKVLSKELFLKNKILTPKYMTFKFFKKIEKKKLIKDIEKKFQFPVVIKPINEGSSVNVFICNRKNFIKNLNKLKFYNEILIEKYIGGREIQVAILGNQKLGVIELKPKRKFYDYKAKYKISAKTKHIIPVPMPLKKLEEVQKIALKAHKLIKCRGVTRSDFKFYNNKFYLLEINTQPGMTKLSLVPEIANFHGLSFIDLIKWLIRDADINK